MKSLFFLLLAFFLPFQSCTTGSGLDFNQRKKGHEKLYSYPDDQELKEIEGHKELVIAVTTNFEGKIEFQVKKVMDKDSDQIHNLRVGGVNALASYLSILREKSQGRFLLVDAGNFLDQEKNHSQTLFYYDFLGYDVLGMGENEFNIKTPYQVSKQKYYETLFSKRRFKPLIGNIFDLKKARDINWKNVYPYAIKNVNDVRVGIIHAIDPELVNKEFKTNNNYYVQPVFEAILKTTQILRAKDVHVIVAIIHSPLDCTSILANEHNLPEDKVNFNPEAQGVCDNSQIIYKMLDALPERTLDLIIAGGKTSKVSNFIHGTPVIKPLTDGTYFSFIELQFNEKEKKINRDLTRIFSPVRLCYEFTNTTMDCYTQEDVSDAKLIPATFLGKEIKIENIINQ